MATHIALIVGLCLVFLLGTALPVNVGAVALVAAFVIGTTFAGMSSAAILGGFPGDLLVTVVGITYLFAIAQGNGTVDLLVRGAVRIVRGRTALLPWVFFCLTGLMTGMGAVSPGAVAIVAPVALRFAYQHNINPLLMGLMVIHGAQAGGFSPLSIYGGITNQVMVRANLPADEVYLFFASLGFNFLAAVAVYLFFGMRRRLPRSASPQRVEVAPSQTGPRALNGRILVTLLGICALGIGGVALDLNVGLVAMSVAVVLTMLFPREQKQAIDKVPWSTVVPGVRCRHVRGCAAEVRHHRLRGAIRLGAGRAGFRSAAAVLRGRPGLGLRIHGRCARRHHPARSAAAPAG